MLWVLLQLVGCCLNFFAEYYWVFELNLESNEFSFLRLLGVLILPTPCEQKGLDCWELYKTFLHGEQVVMVVVVVVMMMMMMRGQKPWLILSSEMGKVQSIFFVCLFVCQPNKNTQTKLTSLLFLFGGI
jgi:hypothetical protein